MKRWAYDFHGADKVATFNMLGIEAATIEQAAAAIRLKHGEGEITMIHLRARASKSSTSVVTHSDSPDESNSKQ